MGMGMGRAGVQACRRAGVQACRRALPMAARWYPNASRMGSKGAMPREQTATLSDADATQTGCPYHVMSGSGGGPGGDAEGLSFDVCKEDEVCVVWREIEINSPKA